jgi:hypothetical protein
VSAAAGWRWLFLCSWPLAGAAAETPPARVQEGHAGLTAGSLSVVVADNAAFGPDHRAGYSGLAGLRHGASRNLFVPAFAGLNFEHIFSGDAASFAWDIFEPRRAAMELWKVGERTLELRQERTANWPLRSALRYELTPDGAIDMTVTCTPLEDAWKKHGAIGLFFASYIDRPEDIGIHFIGRSRPGRGDAAPRWIHHLSPRHGEAACHRPAGSTWDPLADAGFKISLASGHSNLEYTYPFYYGVAQGKALAFLFEKPTADGEIRLAQSPTGGGDRNPAWDFVYLRRRHEVGKPFTFRMRLVVGDFTGREAVVKAYEAWSGEKVVRPGS